MTDTPILYDEPSALSRFWRMLCADKMALCAAFYLIFIVFFALFGPWLIGDIAADQDLRGRNMPPFDWDRGLIWAFGSDALGRPLLPRILVAGQNTLAIAAGAVLGSAIIGTTLGLIAGYSGKILSEVVLRLADIIMSFPSLLIALIVLSILGPSVTNLIIVLAITRIPVYLRTTRAEVLEIRERMFVQAAQVMGAPRRRVLFRHILPVVIPTLTTVATLDFAFVMLAESALSFLGIGIQPPDVTWGLMIAQGRAYLTNAWWLSFWPGLAIILTTLSLTLLSNWLRIALDPVQRWRLEMKGAENG
ncbi:ABC transporter permease [Falsirhodobacter halotolerans]|uniref:ABC transporter permease n=1 Tax=Falsirhodobacter halotolerans TaxID=1146892 RepID=UPI001FD42BF8|nr:ABC transporter permease [Falsirhodobacter halotolerans]MCJ8141091.1 ABC transporter permease [Falsirhodobacter halotolerans]